MTALRPAARHRQRPTARHRQRNAGGGHSAALTLADQVISSATNFAVGVLIARAGGAGALGTFGIAFLVWLGAVGVNRALVTEPMTVGDVTASGGPRLSEGMAATLLLGLGWAGLLGLVWGGLHLAGQDQGDLLALAPWMPSLLLQDYWRSTGFRLHRADRALISDGVFALAQVSVTVVLFGFDVHDVAAYIASWGIGATAGAVAGLVMFRLGLALRGGGVHLRALWVRSRWFAAEFGTAFISDQGYLFLLPALIGTAQFGLYRAGVSLIGPAVIIFLAGGNVGLPQCVRRLREHGMPGLLRYMPRLSVAVIGLTSAYCVLVAVLAQPVLRLVYGARFTDAAVIAALVAAQYVLFSISFARGVALKAAGQIRQLWVVRMAGAAVSITSVTVLARCFGLPGAGCAAVLAGAVYTVGVAVAFRRLRRRSLSQ